MRAAVFVLAALVSMPLAAQAQVKPEVRPFVGAFVPTGAQRDVFKSALLTGAQFGVEVADQFHVVGTFAFSGPDFKASIPTSSHLRIYQADVGGEAFQRVSTQSEWELRPFIGLGAGVRTYDPTGSMPAKSYPAGYAAIGTEFQFDRIALRLEGRDYVTRFKGLDGGDKASTRNELAFNLGLAYHLR